FNTHQDIWNQIFQVYDDAFLTRGNHGLKFGFMFLAQQNDIFYPQGADGGATFTSALATAVATADCTKTGGSIEQSCGGLVNFLTNQPRTSSPSIPLAVSHKHYLRDKVFGGYVQDDWRFRPSLTLNL